MRFDTKRVTLGTGAATQLTVVDRLRRRLRIANEDGTNHARIGPSTVVNSGGAGADAGFILRLSGAGESFEVTGDEAGLDYYAIADAATPIVSVAEWFDD